MEPRLAGVCGDIVVLENSVLSNTCVEIKENRVIRISSSSTRDFMDLRGEGTVIVPAVVDLHVHLRGLRNSYKEDEYTGTLAAAWGGVGIVADMPNTDPPIRSIEALKLKLSSLAENAIVDYVVYAGVPDKRNEIKQIAKYVVGFKLYPEDLLRDKNILCEVFRTAATMDKIVVVHAEIPELSRLETGWQREVYHSCASEMTAIFTISTLLNECNVKPRIHVTHVSCPNSAILARKIGFTVDTTPHHLLANEVSEFWSCSTKVNPPLRKDISHHLIQQIIKDEINCISSDHAPHAEREKDAHPLLCPPGIASIEHWPRILLSYFIRARLGLSLWTKLVSKVPATILGLDRIGCINVGCKAYLAIYRLNNSRVIVNEFSKSKRTPYFMHNEIELVALIIRGHLVVHEDYGLLVDRGYGSNLII